ncbi:MAG: hypothetical protein AB3X44_03005 [Leptothrix sp. (in: b-proteobacteria)]
MVTQANTRLTAKMGAHEYEFDVVPNARVMGALAGLVGMKRDIWADALWLADFAGATAWQALP